MPLSNIKSSDLVQIAVKPDQYPDESLPEIAFAGRSNVGKSSLLNGIMNRKSLARTSSKPGKTRTINFYGVNDEIRLVDLPGYGYAIASQKEKENWKVYIETYLESRKNLKAIVLVVDIRHEPTNDDKVMYDWLKHYGYKIVIAATKLDKIKRSQIQKQVSLIRKSLGLGTDDIIIPFSGVEKKGKEELWKVIDEELLKVEE